MKDSQWNQVGIDVGSKELVVKLEGQLQAGVARFDNNKAGHKKLIRYVTKNKTYSAP